MGDSQLGSLSHDGGMVLRGFVLEPGRIPIFANRGAGCQLFASVYFPAGLSTARSQCQPEAATAKSRDHKLLGGHRPGISVLCLSGGMGAVDSFWHF